MTGSHQTQAEAKGKAELYQTKARCYDIHEKVERWGKWLVGLLVTLVAGMAVAAAQGWSASSKTESLEVEVRSNHNSLGKSLDEIKIDVREIRAAQRELTLRGQPPGG